MRSPGKGSIAPTPQSETTWRRAAGRTPHSPELGIASIPRTRDDDGRAPRRPGTTSSTRLPWARACACGSCWASTWATCLPTGERSSDGWSWTPRRRRTAGAARCSFRSAWSPSCGGSWRGRARTGRASTPMRPCSSPTEALISYTAPPSGASGGGRGRPGSIGGTTFTRHSSITAVYRAKKDLFLAQRFARHASPITTNLYPSLR